MKILASASKIFFLPLLIFIIVYSQAAAQSVSSILVNEFLAKNVRTNPNSDSNEYSDWIELYNSLDEQIDISGYWLSDDHLLPQMWEIPSGTIIASKGYLLIWADGNDNMLHTNFKLGLDGEQVTLSDPAGNLIDSVTYEKQLQDVSFGRNPDLEDQWVYFPYPTPGESNSKIYTINNNRADKPSVSIKGGIYNSSQTIQLFSTGSSNNIRYTLDGSVPTHESTIYTNSLSINSTSVLTARIFADGYLPGESIYNTYIINENVNLPIISIITDPENFWNDEYGIYTVGTNGLSMWGMTANYWQEWERPVHFELYEFGEQAIKMDAGIAINGARRNMPQKSFKIFARSKYGKNGMEYKLFDDKPIENFSSVIFRNGGHPEFRYTMFKDGMLQYLIASNMDIDYQSYKPAVLFVNGEYWGIYNIREKQNEDYLEANKGVNPDSVDLLEMDAEVIEGDAEDYNNLIKFIQENEMSNVDSYEYIKTKIDIDEYLNYLIAEIYIANFD